ncbi:MAG: DNA-processing protein DprA [Chitinophagaceae bacterium]
MNADLPFQIALTQLPQIGPVCARQLVEHLGTAEAVFKTASHKLEKIPGMGQIRVQAIRGFNEMARAKEEAAYVEHNNIVTHFIRDKDYPQRLLHCADAPLLLFKKGNCHLNTSKAVAIIGTRVNTNYGKGLTRELIQGLAALDVLIVSGLAFGIDALAHRYALEYGLPTVGVMANGIDLVYPPHHLSLAQDMMQNGGAVLTEFMSGTLPDRHHFPLRNRIVAGLADAIVVVETGDRGGSLITADLAWGYNRDVFAFPGRVSDLRSAGCNELIRQNKAGLLRSPSDLIEALNWDEKKTARREPQRLLFVDLSADEDCLLKILGTAEKVSIDELNWQSGLSASQVAAALLGLELKNLVVSLPGRYYQLQ